LALHMIADDTSSYSIRYVSFVGTYEFL